MAGQIRLRNLKLVSTFLFVVLAGGGALAQTPETTPVSPCASCHSAQSISQPLTPMGQALQQQGANPTLIANPKLTFKKAGYSYSVETKDGKSMYNVTDGTQTLSLPIRWSMGAGAQTWVLEYEGKLYESLVSYYPSIPGLDITTGDEEIVPKNVAQATGRELAPTEPKACFSCHASNSFVNGKLNFDSLTRGINCEHCHTGAGAHLVDALQGRMDSAPPDLKKLSSEDIAGFCGQCHRSWDTVVRNHWHGQATVRFQPYRLSNSKCFDGTDPRIGCLACHDPHHDVVREASYYDSKCLACHASSAKSSANTIGPNHAALNQTVMNQSVANLARSQAQLVPASASSAVHPEAKAPACPVAQNNCTTCHMPKINLPNGHLTFSDHQIRIVKPGAPFPN
jgi:hypothetical protein